MSDMLSKNFSRKELDCNCGCGFIPTQETIDAIQSLRDAWKKPMTITSAARCKKYNGKIGGAEKSQHVEGTAIDVSLPVEDRYSFVKLAMEQGWHGIGVAVSFIHLDRRPGKDAAVWTYSNK